MANEWSNKSLDALGRIVTGKTPPSTIVDAFGGNVPFVTPSDMDGTRIISDTARTLSASGQTAVKNTVIPKNAVMVSCIGSDMGKAALAGADCITNQQINSIVIDTDDSPLFVYYNLSTRKSEIRGAASGSAQPILNKSAFGRLEIELPPPEEQRAIAHILGTLDDKIELNRKQNEMLEAMARTLFKAWFVDFEPVRAKLEGRWQRGQSLPGLPAHLYDLFPDRLVESELGEIPEGWGISDLGNVCSYLNRGISPKYIDLGGVFVLNQKCIRDFSIDFSKARRHDVVQKKIDGRALELGDVLVNSTGVGTLGRVAQVKRLSEATIVDSHVTVVRAGPQINPMYLGAFMNMKQPEIEAMGEGSTGQTELSRTKLGALKILLPTDDVLNHFAKHTQTVSESIAANQKNSETLA